MIVTCVRFYFFKRTSQNMAKDEKCEFLEKIKPRERWHLSFGDKDFFPLNISFKLKINFK